MNDIKNIRKNSILLVIGLTFLMMAVASVNADRIRDAPDIEISDVEVMEHHLSNSEEGDLIVAPAQEEPLIVAPTSTVEEIKEDELEDSVISPQEIQKNEDGKDIENSLIATRYQNDEDTITNMGLPALTGIALISGILVLFLLFKRKK